MLGSLGFSSGTPSWVGIIPLRIGTGLTLFYLHGWSEASGAVRHLWDSNVHWGLIALLEKATMPYPNFLAYIATIIGVSTAVFWMVGFLTRFFATLFVPLAIGVIVVANHLGETGAAEAGILYLFVAFTLIINGSGWFSVDALFERERIQ